MNNDRRTNALMREFITLIQSAIERRDMDVERAAEMLVYHQVPPQLVAAVLSRSQARHTTDWSAA